MLTFNWIAFEGVGDLVPCLRHLRVLWGGGGERTETNRNRYVNTTACTVYSQALFPALYLIHTSCLFIQYTLSALVVLDI